MIKPLFERIIVSFNPNICAEYYYEADISSFGSNPTKYTVCSSRGKHYREKGSIFVLTHDGYVAELPIINITQIIWTGEYSERDDSRRQDYQKSINPKEESDDVHRGEEELP
jgi:hypothetical protein